MGIRLGIGLAIVLDVNGVSFGVWFLGSVWGSIWGSVRGLIWASVWGLRLGGWFGVCGSGFAVWGSPFGVGGFRLGWHLSDTIPKDDHFYL